MPAYNAQVPPPSLGFAPPLSQYVIFKAEALTLSEFSQQICIPLGPTTGQKGIRFEGDFNHNPGNVEIDVLECSTDTLGSAEYQQVPTSGNMDQTKLVTGPNGALTHFGLDLIPFAGDFLCLFVKVAPSNGGTTFTGRITRIA